MPPLSLEIGDAVRVVTRFAPSPTGSLHLGGARTALFNWLFARQQGGKFLLRIEDTDEERSSKTVAESIIEDLQWLALEHDGDVVFQSTRKKSHLKAVQQLLALGKAYYCYCSEEEVSAQRLECEKSGKYYKHCCPWRDKQGTFDTTNGAVRFRSPENSLVEFVDGVYGKISVNSEQIDDMVVLRSSGVPTYLLAVVVDDHDMEITHVIRGSDHITNTIKQILLTQAMEWSTPEFFHIPLIHDENGGKLSKRNRAPGVHEYKELGFLPEALCNYLLRMGWSYKEKEIIPIGDAIKLFSLEKVGVSHSCLDYKKLLFLNHHYMNQKSPSEILPELLPFLEKELGSPVPKENLQYLSSGLVKLMERSKTLAELAKNSLFYVQDAQITIEEEAIQLIEENLGLLLDLTNSFLKVKPEKWKKDLLLSHIKGFAKTENVEHSAIYHLLRATIVGRMNAPSIIEVMEILGQEKCTERLKVHCS